MSNQNNWMYYNNGNQGNQQYHLMQNNNNNGNGNSANNNCMNGNNNSQQQQQNNHSQPQYSIQQQQQYNEQIMQVMQQQYNHQMHHAHSQGSNNGMVQPPPGIAFMHQTFPQGQFPHQYQQVYSQQQQSLLLQQQQQQHTSNSSNNSSPNQNHQSQPQNINNSQQFQAPQSQSPQTNQQQQQPQQQQNSGQQQPKLSSKLQKQYSLMEEKLTQASEEERSISSYQQEEFLLEHLELSQFKIYPCPNQNMQHNHKQCQFYHGLKDRRREGTNYSHDPCQFIDSFGANCPLGDKCPKSHNKVEQLYRPDKYKTKFCTLYPSNCKSCEYGIFCSFAHSENDINTELIHNYEYDVDFYIFYYKTVWCPFNYINHDRGMCVYAHNWQDYRRKPHSIEFGYEPDGCESWNPNSFITEYEIGCPNKQNCKKCHGWKELEYHPKIYRTKPCQQQPCPKGKACPYYHNLQEKRNLSNNIQSELFRYAPRNRITKNLFKQSQHLIPKEIKQPQQPGGGGNNNNNIPVNGNNNINNQTCKIAQFNSSHSLSSQNNNSIANYQGYQDNPNINTQQVKKQASLNSKKAKGSAVLQKMNTCNDLSSNFYEESKDNERYQQFQSVYQEKTSQNQPSTQSPLKKPGIVAANNNNNPNKNVKRSESQQFEEYGTQNSTPQPQFGAQEEQKKQLKIAVPFILEEQKDSGKKQATSEGNSSQQQYSGTKQNNNQQQSQNQQDSLSKDQQTNQIVQFDQYNNAFQAQPSQPSKLQRQNTQNSNQSIPYQVHYDNSSYNNQNTSGFPQQSGSYSKQNSMQSINNCSSNNLDNVQQKNSSDKQDDDYDFINELISNF